MAGRIDLPTLVQRIRVDTRSMTEAEKKANRFGRSMERSLAGAADSTEDLGEATERLGKANERAEGPTVRLTSAIKAQRKATEDTASALAEAIDSSTDALRNQRRATEESASAQSDAVDASEELRVAHLRVAVAQGEVEKASQRLIKIREDEKKSAGDLAKAELDVIDRQRKLAVERAKVQKITSRQVEDTDRLAASNDRLALSLAGLARGFHNAGRDGNVLTRVIGMLKVPALAGALGLAAGAITSLGAGLVGMTAQLSQAAAPLTGVLAALPAGIIALKSSTAVFKQLTEGPLEAAKAIQKYGRDSQQAADAYNVLNPAARRFTNELTAITDRFGKLKKAAQSAALPGFTEALRDANELMPILRRGMTGVGESMSRISRLAGRTFTSDAFKRDLGLIAGRNARLVDTLGRAAIRLVSALRGVVVAAGPMVDAFAAAGLNLARFTDRAANSAEGQAKMADFFRRTTDSVFGLLRVLRDAGAGLRNFGRLASEGIGIDFSGGIADATARFREFTESTRGSNKITQFFADARPALIETGRLLRDLAKGFGEMATDVNVAPLIAQLRTELLPAILDLVTNVSSRLGPALIDVATAFIKVNSVLTASPLLTIVQAFARASIAVADFVSQSSTLTGVAATVLSLVVAFKGLAAVGRLTGFSGLANNIAAIGPAGTSGAKGIAGLVQGLRGAAGQAGTTMTAMNRLGTAIRGLSTVSKVGLGALGIALGAAATAFAIVRTEQNKARQVAEEYTAAIEADTGALGENTRTAIANRLEKAGALEAARQLGIEHGVLTDAILGNKQAYDQVIDAVLAHGGAAESKVKATESEIEAAVKLARVLGIERDGLKAGAEAERRKRAEINATTEATKKATEAASRYSDFGIGSMVDRASSAARAQNSLARAFNAAKQAINNKRKVTLDESDALLTLADQARATAQATYDLTKSEEKADAVLTVAKDNFIATARAMGYPIERARELARELGLIPPKKKVDVAQPGMPAAIGNTKLLGALIDGIPSIKQVTILINTVETRDEAVEKGTGENPRQADAMAQRSSEAAAAKSAKAAERAARAAAKAAADRVARSIGKGGAKGAADGIADLVPKTDDIEKEADKKATAAEKAAERLKEARKKIIQEAREAARGLAEGIRGMGNVVGSGNEEEGTNILRIIGHLRQKVAEAKRFTKDLRELVKRGINPVTFRQIVEAGPEAGGPAARALASASDAHFAEVNQLQKKLNVSAQTAKGIAGKELIRVGLDNMPKGSGGGTTIGTQIGKQINIDKVEQNFHNAKQETQTESSNKALRRMSATLERA